MVFSLGWAAILMVRDAIPVVVQDRIGTTVLVFVAKLLSFLVRTPVVHVRDQVVVVVRVEATVLILEPVQVLWQELALVLRVGDSIRVGVGDLRGPGQAHEGAQERCSDPVVEPRTHDQSGGEVSGSISHTEVSFDQVRRTRDAEIRRQIREPPCLEQAPEPWSDRDGDLEAQADVKLLAERRQRRRR